MHLFGSVRLKPSTIHYPSPSPIIQCWEVLGDQERNFVFQHCAGGVGEGFTVRFEFVATVLSKIVVSCVKYFV